MSKAFICCAEYGSEAEHYQFSPLLSQATSSLNYESEITESHNYRGWKGPLEIIESSPPAKQDPYSRLQRQAFRRVFNTSREGEITQPDIVRLTINKLQAHVNIIMPKLVALSLEKTEATTESDLTT